MNVPPIMFSNQNSFAIYTFYQNRALLAAALTCTGIMIIIEIISVAIDGNEYFCRMSGELDAGSI
jgi:hypothetical protein